MENVIDWNTVTTEDLKATIQNYKGTEDAKAAAREFAFRCDGPCACGPKAVYQIRDIWLVCPDCGRRSYHKVGSEFRRW